MSTERTNQSRTAIPAGDRPGGTRIRVWDLPTRVFHWSLAACVVGLVATGQQGGEWMPWHARLGYAVGTLLLFRLAWGFAGGHWSRFRNFPPSPRRAFQYLRGQSHWIVGHSPLGALSVYAMLVVLAVQVGTGLCSEREDFGGPLAATLSNDAVKAITQYHRGPGQWLVWSLVALHVAAIALYQWRGKRLVAAMWTGDATGPDQTPSSSDRARHRLAAAVLLLLCALPFVWLARLGA
jgi:cytochrome b